MPSRNVYTARRSRRSKTRSPIASKFDETHSPLQSLLGANDSILETVENAISDNASRVSREKYVREKDDSNIEMSMELGTFTQSEYCDLSRRLQHNVKRSLERAQLAERKEGNKSELAREEYQWQEHTLFEQACVEVCLDDSSDLFESSILQEKRFDSRCSNEKADFLAVSDRESSFVGEEYLVDDLSFKLEEQDEFSIMQKENFGNNSDEVKRVICNKNNSMSNSIGSFYGLPERVKKLIHESKNINSLYDWQDECLNLEAVKNRRNLIYALPTSGGKTLVAEILMLREILCNKKNVIFVLPFVAIVQEKVQSMTRFALELGFLVEEYAGGKGQYPPMKRRRKNSIYICTIEKAQGLVNSLIELKRLDEIGIVVIDELHLIGEDGGRGATLEGLLTKLLYVGENIHMVGMSATIGNLDEIARFLKADIYTQNFRPVHIKEYVKCEDRIWLLNLKEDSIFTDEKKINYRYSESANKLDPDRIGGLVMDVVPKDSCLVFCSNRKNCENVATLLTRVLFRSVMEYKAKEKEELLCALRYEGELCPVLSKTIKFGVAYHHSGLTSEERKLLEDAFREGTLCVLCCTSTLAAGVNLPARRVILRSPYVGNQFLSLSRYKQMIGRAGRAGMGEIGESILICNRSEIPKVEELLKSRMDDCLSTVHQEVDRGINNLILSSVMLSMASTRSDLHRLVGTSLLGVQEKRLELNVKSITDKAISDLLKAGVLRRKRSGDFDPNVTVAIESQINDELKSAPKSQKGKRTILLTMNTILELSPLGRAAMKGSIDLQCAYTLYQDLKIAQDNLVLANDLHIMYLITPYDLAKQLTPVGSVFYNVVTNLSASHMMTPRALGINEATIAKLRDGAIPKGMEPRVVNRFWLTLILYELWQHRPLYVVAEQYQVNRGLIQNLLNSAATFANSVVRFCQELQEFWAFTDLLGTFSNRLRFCCAADLEPLMELPSVKVARARQLFTAGYKTLQSIATARPDVLESKIRNLSKKTVIQMIAAANLLLLEKVENLRDEAAEVMEGLDVSHFEWDFNR